MESLDYRSLPIAAGGYSELFFDYLHEYSRVAGFFTSDFHDAAAYEGVAKSIARKKGDRSVLVSVLEEQNTSFGCTEHTMENISLLREDSTFAVVTGQQVGFLGGPLYTVFKTITAIKLATRLKSQLPMYDFVPVFWIEGEDHDFAEMNHTSVLDAENKVVRIDYLPGGVMPERNVGAMGELVLDSSVGQAHSRLKENLQRTEFTDALLSKVADAYREGRTFNQAFTSWMNVLFEGQGLVFISPNHPRLKKLLSPLFLKEISEYPKTSQLVISRSAELEKEYHAQIKAKSINLFMFHKGGRYLIEPRENDFSLKGTRHFISKEELVRVAVETPELLSTNVVLRPIAQDTLLPTVAYVAGPSEVAYHAQLAPVYEEFGMPQPVVYPRAGASFVEERVRRAMEKYSLTLQDFLDDIDRVTSRVVGQISDVKIEQLFADTTGRLHEALHELEFGLKEVDPTLLGALEGMKSKIDINLGVLKEKSIAAQKRRNEVAVRQIEKAAAGLLPNGGLQERELSIIHFLNKYGPDLVKLLLSELDITSFKHQVLTL